MSISCLHGKQWENVGIFKFGTQGRDWVRNTFGSKKHKQNLEKNIENRNLGHKGNTAIEEGHWNGAVQ